MDMKRSFSKCLAILIALAIVVSTVFVGSIPVVAEELSGTCGESVMWSFNRETSTLTISGEGEMYNYNEYNYFAPWYELNQSIDLIVVKDKVANIGNNAFRGLAFLKSFVISSSVVSIGQNAFNGCQSLEKITIPDNVTDIDSTAFNNCNSVESIMVSACNNAYYSDGNCLIEKGTEKLVLGCKESVMPDTVVAIGEYAFYNCTGLKNITWPENIGSVGYSAFKGCTGITELIVPDSLTNIGAGAFANCSGLTSIFVEEGNDVYYSKDDCVISKTGTLIIGCRNSRIPDDGTVYSIGTEAFTGCTFTEFTIPDSVTFIGESAFRDCDYLEEIVIPGSVKTIYVISFADCDSLKKVILCDGVESIVQGAFSGCDNLEEVIIPRSVTDIGWYPFQDCPKLTLKVYAYSSALKYAIDRYIPYEIISEELTTLSGTCGDNVIWCFNFDTGHLVISGEGDMYSYSGSSAPWRAFGELVNSIEIQRGVTSVGYRTFSELYYLKTVTISNTVTIIDKYAFESCTSLKEVVIPDGVITIKYGAFNSCSSLKEVIIPKSVTSIGSYAFNKWDNTLKVYADSYALEYAVENNIPYEIIDEEENIPGDTNGDGSLTISDVFVLKASLLDRSENDEKCDVNGDGKINLVDMYYLKSLLVY